jgi:hypothetical protein
MYSKGPPDWDSIILSSPTNSSSKWSKTGTGKNSRNPVKNRYNFCFFKKIKNKKFVTLTMHVLRSVCPNGSQKQMHLACLTPNPKFYLCIRYIEFSRYLAICYPTYFRVAKLFQPYPFLYSDYFPSIHACKV